MRADFSQSTSYRGCRLSEERQTRCQEIEQESAWRFAVRIHESSNVDEFRNRLTALEKRAYLCDAEIDAIFLKTDARGRFPRKPFGIARSRCSYELDNGKTRSYS